MKAFVVVLGLLFSSGAWACPNYSGRYSIDQDMWSRSPKVIKIIQENCEELKVDATYHYSSGAPGSRSQTVLKNLEWHGDVLRVHSYSLEEWYLDGNRLFIKYSNFPTGPWGYNYTEEYNQVQ